MLGLDEMTPADMRYTLGEPIDRQLGNFPDGSRQNAEPGVCAELFADAIDAADSAPNRDWDKHPVRSTADDVAEVVASVQTSDDVNIEQLISSQFCISNGVLLRVTNDPQAFKMDDRRQEFAGFC